ncbi:MAG TPA: hypothetical protein VF484_08535 [Candidatus Limnocylindrales bacterium]
MLRPRSGNPAAIVAVATLLTLLLAACSTTPTVAPSLSVASPAGSGAATGACQTAPDPGSLPGWQPPSSTPAIFPQIVANPGELTCGKNRLIFPLLDANLNDLSKPDRTATVALYDLARDATKPYTTVDAAFVWAIESARGIYIANVQFPEAGTYGAEVTTAAPGSPAVAVRVTFSVDASSPTVRVGQKAPSTKTPTAADVNGDLAQISTDGSPDPAFYKISEDQALAKHDPFVMIFATPKFCTSAQCGPTLERLKPFAAKYPTVDFIHVEPYELKFANGQLQAVLDANQGLVANQITNTWGLTGEPWVFTVDKSGTITGSFELIFSDAELTSALDAIR